MPNRERKKRTGSQPPPQYTGETKTYCPGMPTDGTYNLILVCIDCPTYGHEDAEFVWTWDAQLYFQERNYTDPPQRCKECHTRHKREMRRQKKENPADDSSRLDAPRA